VRGLPRRTGVEVSGSDCGRGTALGRSSSRELSLCVKPLNDLLAGSRRQPGEDVRARHINDAAIPLQVEPRRRVHVDVFGAAGDAVTACALLADGLPMNDLRDQGAKPPRVAVHLRDERLERFRFDVAGAVRVSQPNLDCALELSVRREPQECEPWLLGVRLVRFHDLRHTTATVMLAQGIDVRTVADVLGHSDVATALRTYVHATEGTTRRAAQAMGEALVGR